jgi:soluble lytic murein transglycosylase-like protein
VKRRLLVYGVLGLALASSVGLLVAGRNRLSGRVRRLVARTAARHGLQAALVRAVILAESGGDPDAVSRAGAYGLMQLTPGTAVHMAGEPLTVDQILEPERNLDLGCRYLKSLLRRYDDLRLALMAYNAGPGRVDRWRREHPDLTPTELLARAAYGETRHFVRRVLTRYQAGS